MTRAVVIVSLIGAVAVGYAWAQAKSKNPEPSYVIRVKIEKHPTAPGGVFITMTSDLGSQWSKLTMDCEGLPYAATFTSNGVHVPELDGPLPGEEKRIPQEPAPAR